MLTRTYSVQGLIMAFLLASLTGTAYALVNAKRKFQIEFETHSLSKIYLISAISSIPSLMMLNFISLPKPLNLIVGGVVYLFIYATLTPLVKIVTCTELQTALSVLQRIRPLGTIAGPILKYQQRILCKNQHADHLSD